MQTKTQYLNGVKFEVITDEWGGNSVDYFSALDGALSFKRWSRDRRTLATSGTAYGTEAIAALRQVFPRMETQPHNGAADDDGGVDMPAVSFYKESDY